MTIVVFICYRWLNYILFMSYSCLIHGLFMSYSRFIHVLFMFYSCLIHVLLMPYSLLIPVSFTSHQCLTHVLLMSYTCLIHDPLSLINVFLITFICLHSLSYPWLDIGLLIWYILYPLIPKRATHFNFCSIETGFSPSAKFKSVRREMN